MKPASDFMNPTEWTETTGIYLRQEPAKAYKEEYCTSTTAPLLRCKKMMFFTLLLHEKILCVGEHCAFEELPDEVLHRGITFKTAIWPDW